MCGCWKDQDPRAIINQPGGYLLLVVILSSILLGIIGLILGGPYV